MNLLETSLRVPLIIRPALGLKANAAAAQRHGGRRFSGGSGQMHGGNVAVYSHPVESLDIFPTVVALAGLPAPPVEMQL